MPHLVLVALLVGTRARAADLILAPQGDLAAIDRARVAVPDLDPEVLPRDLPSVLATLPPRLAGGGSLERCEGAPLDPTALAQARQDAAGSVAYLEYGAAADTLDAALGRLVCLSGPVDPVQAAHAWFLRGFVAAEEGQTAVAREAFDQALAFQADLSWDADYPDTARPLLEQARAVRQAPTAHLDLLPDPGSDAALVDGRHMGDGSLSSGNLSTGNLSTGNLSAKTLSAETLSAKTLSAGPHLVQVPAGGAWLGLRVDLGPTDQATLVLPALASDALLQAADTAAGQAELDALLGPLLGPTDRVAVVLGAEDPVQVRAAGGGWRAAAAPPPRASSSRPGADDGAVHGGLIGAGAGLAVIGAGLGTTSFLLAHGAVQDATVSLDTQDHLAWQHAHSRYQAAQVLLPAGYAAAGLGGALLVVGVALDAPAGLRPLPWLFPGGAGLRLELHR